MCCKDCSLRECEGRNGYIVCDIDGESHKPDYVCDDYELCVYDGTVQIIDEK